MKTAGSMTGGRASVEVAPPTIEPEKRPVTRRARVLKQRLVVADVLVVALAIGLAFVWQSLVQPAEQLGVQRSHLVLAFLTFPVWIVSFSLQQAVPGPGRRAADRGAAADLYAALSAIGVIVGGLVRRSSSRCCRASGSCRSSSSSSR